MERKLKAVPKTTAPDEDADLDFTAQAEERPPLIEPGEYQVALSRVGQEFFSFGGTRVLLFFKIVEAGPYHGSELFMAVRTSPKKGRKGLAMSSKLVRAWTVAAGRPPTRTDRLSTREFRGKVFKADVETVSLGGKGKPLPTEARYSIVRTLLERLAG